MIKQLEIKNFKCFKDIVLPFKNVNVLSGINGMGKSTVEQAILLLWQSYMRDPSLKCFYLNDQFTSIGNAQDALCEKADVEELSFKYILNSSDNLELIFGYEPESDVMQRINDNLPENYMDIFSNRFIYLSAFRIKPQDAYGIVNEDEIEKGYMGNNGEYALQYLDRYGSNDIYNMNVCVDDSIGKSLKEQTKYWLGKISPGVSPVVSIDKVMRKSEVRYEYTEGIMKTNSYKSTNVGFGITYVLPVIIALLSAAKDDIIIIENPEAHIHPAGQRILGELIALAGKGGAQIFVETHSDHIINGMRILVKQKYISNQLVKMDFFYRDETDDYKHKVVSPEIMEDGRLDIWPDGFFDEWDKASMDLF